jgi:glutaredoxin
MELPLEVMEVILYSKDNCQWCDRAKMLFDNLDVKYTEYKYEKDFTKKEFYAEFGEGATFPQISINTKHIGGFKDTLHYFQENNLI